MFRNFTVRLVSGSSDKVQPFFRVSKCLGILPYCLVFGSSDKVLQFEHVRCKLHNAATRSADMV